jgi:hypothetical protein
LIVYGHVIVRMAYRALTTASASPLPAVFKGMSMLTNDNSPAVVDGPWPHADPHGHAALLLVESLIHGLCEASLLSDDGAIAVAERAVSVQFDHAKAADTAAAAMWRSHALLVSIATSLRSQDPLATLPRSVT